MGFEELPGYDLVYLICFEADHEAVPLGGDIIEVVAPFKDGTTAGRILEKRGEGGYMIIMQTEDAKRRRTFIEEKGLAKVIFQHETGDSVCIQYHPKGIKGESIGRTAQLVTPRSSC